MGEQWERRSPNSSAECMECCEKECREKCRKKCCPPPCPPPEKCPQPCPPPCPPEPCCPPPAPPCGCNEGSGSGIWLIILIAVIYLLFCNNDRNGNGGLFGGLF